MILTFDEIDQSVYYLHHTSRTYGYISRMSGPVIEPYSGRFGTGFKIHWPDYDSTGSHDIEYWIKKGERKNEKGKQ